MFHRDSRSFLRLRFTALTIQIVDGTLFAASTSAACEPRGTAVPFPPPVQAVVATAWLRRLVHSKDDFQENSPRQLILGAAEAGETKAEAWLVVHGVTPSGRHLAAARLRLHHMDSLQVRTIRPRGSIDLAKERAQAATENPSETNRLAQRRTAGCGEVVALEKNTREHRMMRMNSGIDVRR